jgi:hypothetical protein
MSWIHIYACNMNDWFVFILLLLKFYFNGFVVAVDGVLLLLGLLDVLLLIEGC